MTEVGLEMYIRSLSEAAAATATATEARDRTAGNGHGRKRKKSAGSSSRSSNNNNTEQKEFFASCVSKGRLDLAMEYISLVNSTPALYRNLLSCCTRANDFEGARFVYTKQKEAGYTPNEFVYSNLISAAGRAKDPASAAIYLEEAVDAGVANTVVVNAAMDAFGRSNQASDVVGLHRRMRKLGIPENTETFNILMQTASRLRRHALVKSFYRRMKRMDIAPTERTFAILLSSGGKLRGPEVAGLADWAFGVLDDIRTCSGIRVNNHILSALFTACAREGKGLHRAKQVLGDCMASQGLKPNSNVWCAFIKLCGSSGNVHLAVDVCEQHCQKPMSPYVRSALFSAIAANGEIKYGKIALKWHDQAHQEWLVKVFREEDTLVVRQSSDETIACNAVIHMCAELGLVQQAFRAYVDMRRCELQPDCMTFNALILACNRANQSQRAIKMYEQMRQAGLEPDEVTYGVLMDTYANECQPDEAMKLFITMKQKGIKHNTVHYTSLINAYSKAGTQDGVQKSFLIYKMMKMSGILPNEVTLSCLIDACRRIYDVDRAFQYFVDACKEGIVPSDGTYNQLLKICHANGRFDEALALVYKMIEEHVESPEATMKSLIRVLSAQHHVEPALSALAKMQGMGLEPSVDTVSTLILVCCQNDYTADAYDLYANALGGDDDAVEGAPDGLVFSSLVASLASANRFAEMLEVRKACYGKYNQSLDLSGEMAFVAGCCSAELMGQAEMSFNELTKEGGESLLAVLLASQERLNDSGAEDMLERAKSMFDTVILSSCRSGRMDLALKAFDLWRTLTWELEKHQDHHDYRADRQRHGHGRDFAASSAEMRLSKLSLAFLESCCKKRTDLEWRVNEICAEMRRQQYGTKKDVKSPRKLSHHFTEKELEDQTNN